MASTSLVACSKKSFVCLICCNTWIYDNSFKKNSIPDSDDHKIFQTFSENFDITLECPYDFEKESIPFCPTCKEMTRYMFHLDTQIQSLKLEFCNVVSNVKGRIDKSSANFELQNLSSVVDKRFSKLRRIILESNSKGTRNPKSNTVNLKGSALVTNQHVSRSQQKEISYKEDDDGYSGAEDSRLSSIQDDDDSRNVVIKQENEPSDKDSDYELDDQGGSGNSTDDGVDDDYPPSKKSKKSKKVSTKLKYQKYPRMNVEKYQVQKPTSDSNSELRSQRPARAVKRKSDGKLSYGGFDFIEIEDGFKCCTCDNRTFKTRGGTLVHIRHFHLEEFPEHVCGRCGKVCDSPSALKNHEMTHSDVRNEVCTICGKAFKNQKNLRRHLIETHKTRLTFSCSICEKSCKNKQHLDDHIQKEHSSIYYCGSCGQAFDEIESMELHRKDCATKKYFQCFYCEANYLKHENFAKHMEEEHAIKIVN